MFISKTTSQILIIFADTENLYFTMGKTILVRTAPVQPLIYIYEVSNYTKSLKKQLCTEHMYMT
jgi:hypothetical protein